MKRKTLWMFLLLALAARLAAASLSLKAGLARASMISGYEDKALTGFQLGLGGELPLFGRLALAAEPAYVRRGTAEGMPQVNPEISNRIVFDCLELPLLLRWRPGRAGARLRPALHGGLYAAYALGVKSTFSGAGLSYDEDIDADVHRLDFGLLAGAGCEFPLFGRTFLLEGRFHKGLRRLNKADYLQPWKTASLGLLLGVRI